MSHIFPKIRGLAMSKLSTAQKIYAAVVMVIAVAWLGLGLGLPAYEYSYGKSELTTLLKQVAAALQYALFGAVILAWLLQRIGVLPTVQPDPALDRMVNPAGRVRNLAIWIVIALALVFFFNLMENKKAGHGAVGQGAIDLFINYFPMLLIAGIWIFFMAQFQKKKKKDLEGGNNP
jgi:hypothetical protein